MSDLDPCANASEDRSLLERVGLVVSPEPFSGRVAHLAMPAGLTIAEILAAACNDGGLDMADREAWEVYVDGAPLDIAASLRWQPAAGQTVNVLVRPRFGAGSGKGGDVGRVLTQIAIIAVAAWMGGIAGAKAGAAFGAATGKVVGAVTTAAVYTAGSMAAAEAYKPDELTRANDVYALQGQANNFRIRGMFPLCLGERRWAFDVCAQPYTSMIGNESYITVGFAMHYGPCGLKDLKIGETLVSDMPAGSVTVETFLTPGPRNSYLYPKDVDQQQLTINLDPWTHEPSVQTAPAGTNRIEIDYAHPGGLKFSRTDGKIDNQKIRVRAEKAPVGTESWTLAQQIDSTARTNDPIRKMLSFSVDPGTQWKIRIVASVQPPYNTEPSWSKQYSTDATIVSAMRSFSDGKPVLDETLACVFIRVKATSNLSGTLPTVSGVVTPRAPVWDAEEQAWTAPATTFDPATWPETSCAAALTRYLLCSYPAARPLSADQIDESFGAQAELIAEKGWTGSVLLMQDTSQEQAVTLLGQLGRFNSYWDGSRLICVPDWIKPAPVQMFTVRNAESYAFERSFPTPIHAVVVEFENTDEGSVPDEVTVFMDGYAALVGDGKLAATLYQAIRLPIACTGDRAQREGLRFLAKHQHQVETHDWTTGRDGLRAARGDRVKVRHYATLIGMADGRVQFRRWTGELVAGVRIDTPVTMVDGVSYVLEVRRNDVLVSVPLVTSPGMTRDLVFAAPLAADEAPQKGNLFAFGEVDLVTEDVEIVDISITDGGFALKGVNYIAPVLVEAEEGTIPPFVSQVRPRPTAPTPRVVSAYGSSAGAVVVFDIDPLRGALITGFSARWRIHDDTDPDANPWQRLAPLAPNERTVTTPSVSAAALADATGTLSLKVDVEITSQITTGEVSAPAYALAVSLTEDVAAKPREGAWMVTGTTFDGASGDKVPGILIVGACDVAEADAILVAYRKTGDTDWTSLPSAQPSATKFEIRSLESEGAYDVQIGYSRAGRAGDVRLYTPVIVGSGRANDTAHINSVPADVWTSSVEASAQAIRTNALAALRNAVGAHEDDTYQSGLLFKNGEPLVVYTDRKASVQALELLQLALEDEDTGLAATRLQFTELIADLDAGKVSAATFEALAAIFYDPATGFETKRAELDEVKGVLADADNLEAYWKVTAAAGPDPAFAELISRLDGSAFRAVAKEIYLASVAGGASRAALKILDNLVTLYGNVLVQGRIKQASGGAGYLLAMESFKVSASNNDVYTMTDVFGAPPDVRPGPPSITLAALGPGEYLDIGTKALSAAAWTAKVEIVTPGTISRKTTTGSATSPGTGPTLQRDKPTVEDAIDGYLFSIEGSAFVTEGLSFSIYEDFTVTGRATAWFNDGSGWMQGSSADIYAVYTSGAPSGETVNFSVAIETADPGPVGQHGGSEFGITVEIYDGFGNPLTPTSLDFIGVDYTTQTGESRRSATPSGQKQPFFVTPRNTAL